MLPKRARSPSGPRDQLGEHLVEPLATGALDDRPELEEPEVGVDRGHAGWLRGGPCGEGDQLAVAVGVIADRELPEELDVRDAARRVVQQVRDRAGARRLGDPAADRSVEVELAVPDEDHRAGHRAHRLGQRREIEQGPRIERRTERGYPGVVPEEHPLDLDPGVADRQRGRRADPTGQRVVEECPDLSHVSHRTPGPRGAGRRGRFERT